MTNDEVRAALEAQGWTWYESVAEFRKMNTPDITISYVGAYGYYATCRIERWYRESPYYKGADLVAALPRLEADARAIRAVVERKEGQVLLLGATSSLTVPIVIHERVVSRYRREGAIEALARLRVGISNVDRRFFQYIDAELERLRSEGEQG